MKKVLLLAVVLFVCMVLVGCSSSTTTKTSSTSNAATPTTSTPSTTTQASPSPAGPKYGGTLTFIYWTGPKTPGGLPWELFANEFLSPALCIEPLIHMNSKGEVIPWLAESLKVADDLKSVTFKLRKGITFIDGTEFNATAAKWNLDKTIESKSQPIWASVDKIDDYTIKLNLNFWDNTAIAGFDGASTWMISPSAYEKNGQDWARNNPTGTGPFKFASFEKDVNYKVVKNPNYWQKGKPYLDGINLVYAADSTLLKTNLQSGQADVCQVEPGKVASDLKGLGFNVEMLVTSVHSLLPDTAHADSPFANQKVREAVEYAINREAIAKAFAYGFWTAPYQIPSPDNPAYNPNFTLARKYDQAKAKQLLSDAGYPNGFKATLEVIPVGYDRNIPLAIQADLAAIGINVDVVIPPVIPKFIEDSNTASNVLLLEPIFGGVNWNSALKFALNPTITPMSQNLIWARTSQYADLLNKSISAPTADVNLMRAVGDFLTQQASVIPVMCGGSGYAHAGYVKNGGWYTRGSDWCPEDIWMDK
jgi:peptide/nickel transport system substrate-binding protein